MRRFFFALTLTVFVLSALVVRPAAAQTGTPPTEAPATEVPPTGPAGKVVGTVVNRNTGKVVAESLEVMLHVLDQDLQDKDMLHAKSEADGSFVFADVPFDTATKFAVMATYEGVTYFSDVAPADMSSMQVSIEVPVYDSTPDLKSVQVDEMHVVFGIAPDGLETKEIYVFSSRSNKTIKDAFQLDGGKTATLEFPLPVDADYIFFEPDDQERFVKLKGGFADTYAILPGSDPSQIMVSYLVPYSGQRTYSYTAPMSVARINFLLPDEADLSLMGKDLAGPESMTLQNGGTYRVYSYSNLEAGQTLSFTITGKGAEAATGTKNNNTPLALGVGILGLLAIAGGLVWWRRSNGGEDEQGEEAETETDFDQALNEIARLDEAHEQGEIQEEEYRERRQALRERAKALLEQEQK